MPSKFFRFGDKVATFDEKAGLTYALSKDRPTPENIDLPDFPEVYKTQARQQGWRPSEVASQTELQGRPIRWPSGRTSVLTNLLTFQLRPEVQEKAVRQEFGLTAMQPLRTGQRFYIARAPTSWGKDDHPFALLKRMQTSGLVDNAEPEIIEFFEPEILDFSPTPQAGAALPWHWGAKGLNLEAVWNGSLHQRGNGMKIGVIDKGFEETHPDLKIAARYRIRHKHNDAHKPIVVEKEATWDDGENREHGTFCAGLAASHGSETGTLGAAHEAQLVLVGLELLSQTALAEAIAICLKEGVRVISCSLNTRNLPSQAAGSRAGWGYLKNDLNSAFQSAAGTFRGKGTAIFWATSNEDGDRVEDNEICARGDVIAVGSFRSNGQRGEGASGPGLEFLAPGDYLTSTIPDSPHRGKFGPVSNSNATPCAAGAAALILNQNPGMTVTALRKLMAEKCRTVLVNGVQEGGGTFSHNVGFGAIDVGAVLAAAPAVAGGVSPPAVVGETQLQPIVPSPPGPEPNNPSP